MANFQCSQDTKDKVALFDQADADFKAALDKFERDHETELERLEKIRDDRNAKLDEAKRALRTEVEGITEMRVTFREGRFEVQKKWSDFFIPEKLVAMLTDRGLYDAAIAAKVIAVKVEVAKFPEMARFLEENKVTKDFECCQDGEESGSAIKGPKPVPPFGAELKKE